LLHIALSPLVSLVEGIATLLLRWTGGRTYKGQVFSNRNELRLLMEDTPETLTSEERGMMDRVFDLNNIAVLQLAIPFARFPTLSADDRVEDSVMRFRELAAERAPGLERRRASAKSCRVRRGEAFDFAEKARLEQFRREASHTAVLRGRGFALARSIAKDAAIRTADCGRAQPGMDGRSVYITLEAILRFIFGEVKL
jgi:hypothetical protein